MLPVAALLDTPAALSSLRRSWPASHGRIKGCRSVRALQRLVEGSLVDVVVIGTRARQTADLAAFRERFPVIPVVVYGAARADEARAILQLEDSGVAAVLVEGVDDPVAGDVVARHGFLAEFRTALADLPRILRLTEPLQRKTFDALVAGIGGPVSTATVARRVRVSREHLSRQFGAGGAPNLKRVIDLLRLLALRDFAVNPGYPLPTASKLLGFRSPRQLQETAMRLVGLELPACLASARHDLTRRFLARGTRSRNDAD